MGYEEAKQAYIDMFGGYPSFLLMGADAETIAKLLSKCVETGKELEPEDMDDVY